MTRGAAVIALLSALVVGPPVSAHEKGHRTAADTIAARAESLGTDSLARDSATATGPSPPTARYAMPSLGAAAFEHPHNKIVHFPIVLTLVATLLLWLPRRPPELISAARLLIWAAAMAAVAAYFTGQAQKEAFEGEPKEWVMRLHRNWGIATGLTLVAWAGLAAWRPMSRIIAWWGALASILIGIVSFIGGVLSHGH